MLARVYCKQHNKAVRYAHLLTRGHARLGQDVVRSAKIIPDFLHVRDIAGTFGSASHIHEHFRLKAVVDLRVVRHPLRGRSEYFHVLGQAVDENGNTYEDKDLVRWWFFKPESIVWKTGLNGARQAERVPDFDVAERIEKNALVIIDEIQNYYSNRDFATNVQQASDRLT